MAYVLYYVGAVRGEMSFPGLTALQSGLSSKISQEFSGEPSKAFEQAVRY